MGTENYLTLRVWVFPFKPFGTGPIMLHSENFRAHFGAVFLLQKKPCHWLRAF